jgi:hypothetical protein
MTRGRLVLLPLAVVAGVVVAIWVAGCGDDKKDTR